MIRPSEIPDVDLLIEEISDEMQAQRASLGSRTRWMAALRREVLSWQVKHCELEETVLSRDLEEFLEGSPSPQGALEDLVFSQRLASRAGMVTY